MSQYFDDLFLEIVKKVHSLNILVYLFLFTPCGIFIYIGIFTNIFSLCTFLRFRGKGHQTTVRSNFYDVPR